MVSSVFSVQWACPELEHDHGMFSALCILNLNGGICTNFVSITRHIAQSDRHFVDLLCFSPHRDYNRTRIREFIGNYTNSPVEEERGTARQDQMTNLLNSSWWWWWEVRIFVRDANACGLTSRIGNIHLRRSATRQSNPHLL